MEDETNNKSHKPKWTNVSGPMYKTNGRDITPFLIH